MPETRLKISNYQYLAFGALDVFSFFFLLCPTFPSLANASDTPRPADLVANIPPAPGFSWHGVWSQELKAAGYSPEDLGKHSDALNAAIRLVLQLPNLTPPTSGILGGKCNNPLRVNLGPKSQVEVAIVLTHGKNATGEVSPEDDDFQVELRSDERSNLFIQSLLESERGPLARTFYPLTVFRVDLIAALPPGRTAEFSHRELVARYLPEVLMRLFSQLSFVLEYPPEFAARSPHTTDQILYRLELQRRSLAVLLAMLTWNPLGVDEADKGPLRQALDQTSQAHYRSNTALSALTSAKTVYVVPFVDSLQDYQSLVWNSLSERTQSKIVSIQQLARDQFADYLTQEQRGPYRWTAATWPLYKKSISILFLTREEWTTWTAIAGLATTARSSHYYGWFLARDEKTGHTTLFVTYFLNDIFLEKDSETMRGDADLRWAKAFGRSHGGTIQSFLETPYHELNNFHKNPGLAAMEHQGFAATVGLLQHIRNDGPRIEEALRAETEQVRNANECLRQIIAAPRN